MLNFRISLFRWRCIFRLKDRTWDVALHTTHFNLWNIDCA